MIGSKVKHEKVRLNSMFNTTNKLRFLTLVFVMMIGCGKQSDNNEDRPELKDRYEVFNTINSCIGWFENKDFDLLYSVVSHDSSYISVHPSDKVIRGFQEFETNCMIFRNPEFKYNRHEIKDVSINFSSSGDVAWFYCILDDINTWRSQPVCWKNTRWTGVLEKRNGNWVIVQQHFSFAAH